MEVRWSISDTKDWQSVSKYQIHNLYGFIFTFGFIRSSERVVRALIDMEYVASNKLGNLVGLGIVLEVHFTYTVRLVQHVSRLPNMFNVPSMTYTTAGPWLCAGTGTPTVSSATAAAK